MTTRPYFRAEGNDANHAVDRFRTVSIDGIPVFDGSAAEAIAASLELAASRGGRVATANLDFLALARRNPVLRQDLRDSDLVIADGMPVVWLSKLSGARNIERLAGVDLVASLFRAERSEPLRVAIYGSTSGICELAVPTLSRLGSGALIVHVTNPPFRTLWRPEVERGQAALAASGANVVLVALGCPAQERLIAEWQQILPTALWIGIGGTLDFYAGLRRRAPRRLQRAGLEWIVRMVQEPRRLGRRYLLRDIPAFAAIVPGCAWTRLTRQQRFQS
jgi:N-acetylglucosaminyldiphosphoundecaprenol N-acetyl-beta-D-mannosaminyltransferase